MSAKNRLSGTPLTDWQYFVVSTQTTSWKYPFNRLQTLAISKTFKVWNTKVVWEYFVISTQWQISKPFQISTPTTSGKFHFQKPYISWKGSLHPNQILKRHLNHAKKAVSTPFSQNLPQRRLKTPLKNLHLYW